jgi:hypothetical protein
VPGLLAGWRNKGRGNDGVAVLVLSCKLKGGGIARRGEQGLQRLTVLQPGGGGGAAWSTQEEDDRGLGPCWAAKVGCIERFD